MRAAFIVTLVTSVVASASISQAAGRPIVAEQRANPFVDLFPGPLIQKPAKPQVTPSFRLPDPVSPGSRSKSRVVCGLTMLPLDPNFDRAMRKSVDRSRVDWSVRTIAPRVCRSE